MRCLVTGVAGFVGSHLAERLLADGHTVVGVDVFTDYYSRSIKERNLENLRSQKGITLIEDNLLNMDLHQLLKGIDWVFHQSAQAGVRASWGSEFAHYVDVNILVTQRLLEAAKQATALRSFVYASSSSVYGDTVELPITEQAVCHPYSPYGVTKLAAEHLCSLYHANFGVPTVSLRYFTVYGPRQRPDMAFHRFCKAVFEEKPIRLFGDGEQGGLRFLAALGHLLPVAHRGAFDDFKRDGAPSRLPQNVFNGVLHRWRGERSGHHIFARRQAHDEQVSLQRDGHSRRERIGYRE